MLFPPKEQDQAFQHVLHLLGAAWGKSKVTIKEKAISSVRECQLLETLWFQAASASLLSIAP
eukprot:12336486-Prorocentrum_lima.AAC.1